MSEVFRDQTVDKKAACQVAEDASDEAWVYCSTCKRAMRQGDCVLGEGEALQCAYEDCPSRGNVAFQSLYGWDAYRSQHIEDTAGWPDEPNPGDCYQPPGAGA